MEDKITTRTIDKAKTIAAHTGKEVFYWDTERKGFGFRASPKGNVSWIVQKWKGTRLEGKAIRRTIGRYPSVDLAKAKQKYDIAIGEAREGKELQSQKERVKADQQKLAIPTLSEAVAEYLVEKQKFKPNPRNPDEPELTEYWGEVRRKFEKEIIPTIGKDTRVDQITKADVKAIIKAKKTKVEETGEWKGKGAARYMYAVLNPFFKWCGEEDYITINPMATITKPETLESRDRVLTDTEIQAFWRASWHLSLFGPFYRLLLLTAQRRDEVAGMRWSEINGDVWAIPKERTKNGKAHIVHLSPQTKQILETIPKSGEFVFSTTSRSAISGFSKAKDRLDQLMAQELGIEVGELKPWVVHDFRRTVTSKLAEMGFPTDVADRILNHVSGSQAGVKGVYQRYEFLNERRVALEAWGKEVERITSGQPLPNNVVMLHKQRCVSPKPE